jgi:Family of unknown function (DUF695)
MVGILILLTAASIAKRNRDNRRAAPESGPFWIYQGNVDGHPLFATINVGLRNSPVRQALPVFFSISSPLIHPTHDGLPTASDADNLNSWEDAVEARIRSTGKFAYVGRVTWNGHRELLYYVAAEQPAFESLRSLADSHSTRPFAFSSERDETWTKADFWLNRH